MKVYKKITKKTTEFVGLKCDTCGEMLNFQHIELQKVDDNGEINGYDFCDEGHAIRFLAKELRKKNPRIDFLYGVTKKEKK